MKGWKTYLNIQTNNYGYKITYNETHAQLIYWTSDSQTHSTTRKEYSTELLVDGWIRPYRPVETTGCDGRAMFQVRDNSAKLSQKSITGSSFNSSVYIQMQWIHRGLN